MKEKSTVKLIAMYFPQLHAIPENDAWWGEGFTDWVNVKRGESLFDGHHQPRVPLDDNYYDQSKLDTLRWQVDLAKKYGIYGFCHYHYWFDGAQLLETPTNLMLDNKDIDMPFCLSWANETWSKRWDGRDHHILIKQTHPPEEESWSKHFDYLIKAWTDEREIKIDDKPAFIIYRPHRIHMIDQMLEFWQQKAKEHGLNGLYFIFQKQYEHPSKECLKSFDAIFQFQPFESIYSTGRQGGSNSKAIIRRFIDRLPQFVQSIVWSLWTSRQHNLTFHNYDEVWEEVLKLRHEPGLKTYSGAFVDWDNTARYGKRATIFKGASPDAFYYWFKKLVNYVSERPENEQYIFLNAWNEWSEGTYLEPDTKHGYKYLEAIKHAFESNDQSSIGEHHEHSDASKKAVNS